MRQTLLILALLCLGVPLHAQDESLFYEVELEAPHAIIDQPYLERLFSKEQKTLILLGKDEERRFFFSLYERLDGEAKRLAVPEDALFFDFLSSGKDETAQIVYITRSGISVADPETGNTQEIIALPSIYRIDSNPNLSQMDFAQDLNGDDQDDLILQDFEGYHILLQRKGGFEAPLFIPFPVEMRIGGQPYYDQRAPRYESFPLYNLDFTLDGQPDIAFLKDRDIHVFAQNAEGQFETQARIISLPIDIVGNSMREFLEAEEASSNRANFKETRIFKIQDVDGDDIVDILTIQEDVQGTFDRRATYGVHFGATQNGTLSFNAKADTSLTIKGFSLFEDIEDVDGDGRFEHITASNDIGIRKIVSALLTGSTKFDLSFYELDAQRRYKEKPSLVKKLRLDFEFSSGNVSVPAVKLADLSGNGVKELVLDNDKKGLRIFNRSDDGALNFTRSEDDYRVDLPKDGQLVQVEDVDGNGRDDLVIHFDPYGGDGEENQNRIIFLLSL